MEKDFVAYLKFVGIYVTMDISCMSLGQFVSSLSANPMVSMTIRTSRPLVYLSIKAPDLRPCLATSYSVARLFVCLSIYTSSARDPCLKKRTTPAR